MELSVQSVHFRVAKNLSPPVWPKNLSSGQKPEYFKGGGSIYIYIYIYVGMRDLLAASICVVPFLGGGPGFAQKSEAKQETPESLFNNIGVLYLRVAHVWLV